MLSLRSNKKGLRNPSFQFFLATRCVEKRTLLGIITVIFLALSSLGFVLSVSGDTRRSFEYSGTCEAVIREIRDTSWIVYTLRDINIPGTPTQLGILTVPTEEIRRIVNEENLLYWTNATVDFNLEGRSYQGEAYVLFNRKPGDLILLNCYALIRNGRLVTFRAFEIPPAS